MHNRVRVKLSTHATLAAASWSSTKNPARPGCERCQHHALALAITTGLALGMHSGAQAQSFPAEINLNDLDGSNGFVLNGEAADDQSGRSVSAGDINGDGINDLVIGAAGADPNGNYNAGRSYVVFGSDAGLPNPFNLSSLNGSNGFVLNGEAASDLSGASVSAAGDINGDGIDDLIIGALRANPNGNVSAGRSYVVFGSDSGLPNPFNLSSLNGSNGFVLNGEASFDLSGRPVSAAGDINGDGIDDLIIAAYGAAPNDNISAGSSYVVFGSDTGLPNPFDLSSLDGTNGFKLNGEAANDRSGFSVSAAGDINSDGIDDLIIGALDADPDGTNSAGRSYVVFGSDADLPNPFNLSILDGSFGFVLNGEAANDRSGYSVSAAGDINGDGIDDLIIGASDADPDSGDQAGRSYVMFGSNTGLPNPFNLSSINGSNGFVLNGEARNDRSGISVSNAGDINGDGIDDLIIGASRADPNGNNFAGRSYVVFGSDNGLPNPLNLSSLNGLNGFVLNGEAANDNSGISVSNAGDINGDGIDDLIIGAFRADPNGNNSAGRSYVVFGRAAIDLTVSKSNGAGFVAANQPTTYFIDVANLSAVEVSGATLTDTLPATLDAGTASWTCSGSGGAVCPNASGTGNISETIDLPIGGMLSYELTATVLATEGNTVTNTATVTLPTGLTDINPANNSATDSDPVAQFADGFEDD